MLSRPVLPHAPEAATHARSAGAAAGGAGLVSYETTCHGFDDLIPIITDPVRTRERRLARLRRNVWAAGKLHGLEAKGWRCWFVTLTYDTRGTLGRGAHEWSPSHIRDALKRYRHWCRDRGTECRYVWVAELQQSGTMHYHVAVWLPKSLSMPKWDVPTRTGAVFWPHGLTQREKARDAVGYLMKYMSKVGGKHDYPKGARIYGIGGLKRAGRDIRGWLNLPYWIKQAYGVGEVVTRACGRVVRETGEVLRSPWARVRLRGQLFLQRVAAIPERWVFGPWCSLRGSYA